MLDEIAAFPSSPPAWANSALMCPPRRPSTPRSSSACLAILNSQFCRVGRAQTSGWEHCASSQRQGERPPENGILATVILCPRSLLLLLSLYFSRMLEATPTPPQTFFFFRHKVMGSMTFAKSPRVLTLMNHVPCHFLLLFARTI